MRSRGSYGIACALVLCAAAVLPGCLPPEPVGGTVVIETEPEDGALVMLGDQIIGETPTRIEGYPPGVTAVVLAHERYKQTSKMIEIPEAGEEVTVTVAMEEREGYLTITSIPPVAEVTLNDDRVLGVTPLTRVPVPLGQHTYTLKRRDHRPVTGEIVVTDSAIIQRTHKLVMQEAFVSIVSSPSDAVVYVNDVPIDEYTPARISLPPGDYTLGAYKDGYILAEMGVRVSPENEQTIEFDLIEGDVPPGMVLVPAGEFIMGRNGESPDERPERTLFVPDFFIDKREVTNLQFQQVYPNHVFDPTDARKPVSGVTWHQAVHYAESVGKQLPTEAQWEKAARGTEKLEYPWGDRFSSDLANTGESRGRRAPVEVGSYRAGASPYGILDMAGNVYEWTSDWYGPYPGNTDIRTTYGQIYRSLRGGSYQSEAFDVRAARRHYDKPDSDREDYGFRCVIATDQ